ncbi:MAG: ribosomal protein L7/L12 [Lysobacteraceae bacterium]
MDPRPSLPQDVIDAIARGDRIGAIRRLREAARIDLKTAHDAVEAWADGRPLPPLPGLSIPSAALAQAAASVLPDDVLDALRGGNRIEAIRRLREATGLGLKDAKDLVEAHEAGAAGIAGPRLSSSSSLPSSSSAPMPTVVSGRSGVGTGTILALLVATALAAWWWFGR